MINSRVSDLTYPLLVGPQKTDKALFCMFYRRIYPNTDLIRLILSKTLQLTWLHGKRIHLYVHSFVQISWVEGISPTQNGERHSTWRILTDVEPHSAEQKDHSDVIHGEEHGLFSHFLIVCGLISPRHFSGKIVESTPASIFNQQWAVRDLRAVTFAPLLSISTNSRHF